MKRSLSTASAWPALALQQTLAKLSELQGGAHSAELLSSAAARSAKARWPEALADADAACELGWCALHTGHWRAVDAVWRQMYMASAYLAAQAALQAGVCGAVAAALRRIDLGLMLGDFTFRPQLLAAAERLEQAREGREAAPATSAAATSTTADADTAAAAVDADAADDDELPPSPPACSSTSAALRPLTGSLSPLPRLRLPPLAYFFNECMQPGQPAVLTGAMAGWPAMSSRPWSDLAYLKRVAGHRTVPVEMGAHYLDDGFDERLMTLAEYLEHHVQPTVGGGGGEAGEAVDEVDARRRTPPAYLAQHALFEQLPRLRDDIAVPDYCLLSLEDSDDCGDSEGEGGGGAAEPRINAWLGPAGTVSPLHHDRYHNLLSQAVGSKYVRLYAPSLREALYPHTEGPHAGVSSQVVDLDADHAARFPRFGAAPYADVVLNAGEMLYIPPGWWHYVESRETSFSVSFWW